MWDLLLHYYRNDVFKYSFFPYVIKEWRNVKQDIQKSDSYLDKILNFDGGRPISHPTYNIHNPDVLNYLKGHRQILLPIVSEFK